jgi:hypothetical protein
MTKAGKTTGLQQALEYVWTDLEKFIKMCAKEHTIANMGYDLRDYVSGTYRDPQYIVDQAYERFLNGICADDDMVDGIEVEYRSWLEDARRDALLLQKAGLPLTLANTRMAFEKRGPFAKKQKRAK